MSSPFKAVLLIALAGLLGGGGAAAALMLREEPDDPSPRASRAIANEADRELAAALTDLGTATKLDELVRAGKVAEGRVTEVRSLLAKADRITDSRYRTAARGVVEADAAALSTISQLAHADVPTASIARRLTVDAERAQAELERAATRWPRSIDPRAAAGPPDVQELTPSFARVARQLRGAERRLRKWRVRVVQIRRSTRAALGVLDSYARSFRTHHRNYQDLRSETDGFISKTDASGSTFEQAYDFLLDAIADRVRIRRGFASLDPPSALAGAHNDVIAALDTAIEAMGDAYDGIVDYQFDDEDYDSYKDTPGWRRFAEKSNALVARYSSSLSDWERRLARARRAITDKPLPARPKV